MSTRCRSPGPPQDFELRKATADDLDSIATLVCVSFPDDPQWSYRFPRRLDYPEDNFEATRKMYQVFMKDEQEEHYHVKVLTARGLTTRPIAVAVWRLEYMYKPHQAWHMQKA